MAESKQLPREALRERLEALRRERPGLRVVLLNGVFDLLHAGHVEVLEAARAEGDLLVVALNDDASARRRKGPGRPFQPLEDRMRILAAFAAVDYVTAFPETDLAATLRLLRPAVHAKGADYREEDLPATERAAARDCGIELRLVGPPKRASSSGLARRIREAHPPGTQDAKGPEGAGA